jgi:hypothetical protein
MPLYGLSSPDGFDSPAFETKLDWQRWCKASPEVRAELRATSQRKSLDFQSRWRSEDWSGRLAIVRALSGRKAAIRFGEVGDDIVNEAGNAAVAAVVSACSFSFGGDTESGFRPDYFMSLTSREVARIGICAARQFILKELCCGQTGASDALWRLRREGEGNPFTRLPDAPGHWSGSDLVLPGQFKLAAQCVRSVLTALAKRVRGMNRMQLGRARRSAARVARVLRAVCFGESLAVACERLGYGWDTARSRSMGFQAALRKLGLETWLNHSLVTA